MTQARNPPADEGERKVSDAVERARQQWESTLPNGADESEDAAFLAGWAARETEGPKVKISQARPSVPPPECPTCIMHGERHETGCPIADMRAELAQAAV